jgi:hypothetical protein
MTMAKTNPKTHEKKASRVQKMLGTLSDRHGVTIELDLTYIDNLGSGEHFRDEFVRLPYDTPANTKCHW